jgi:hypothetical protein
MQAVGSVPTAFFESGAPRDDEGDPHEAPGTTVLKIWWSWPPSSVSHWIMAP